MAAEERERLRPPSRLRLVDSVCQSLEEAILSARIRPGERLVETAIADQLGVSRTTIREAFLMLQQRGLIQSTPRGGTFVTRLSREDALDLGYTRALLEGFALTAGQARIDREALARLESSLGEMACCRLPVDFPRLVQIDLAFHGEIVGWGHSARTLELWSSLNGQLGALYIRGVEEQHLTVEGLVSMHRRLLAAICSGDVAAARQALIAHYVREGESDSERAEAIQDVARDVGHSLKRVQHSHGVYSSAPATVREEETS